MWYGLVLCLVVALVLCSEPNEKQVRTAQGTVKGHKEDGVFVFYGIPYATAPTGVNKFMAPMPPSIRLEPFDAVDKKIICPQADLFHRRISLFNSQENCLIANIYVPDTQETNLPVVVLVHGGGFQSGSGSIMVPKKIVNSKKIIAVTFNYRLGIHGFLCLGTKQAPGNAGMKDQVALLRWVKKNIASFGGNPEDVTIEGFSAGASAVDLLPLSNTTKGLIHKVIPESGSNLAVCSVQMDPLQIAKDHAKKLGFDNADDIQALENFYTNMSFDTLTAEAFFDRKDSTFAFTPCVERNIGEETFLEEAPYNILKQRSYSKLPMLYGVANMEGIFRFAFGMFDSWAEEMNHKFSDFLPADLQFQNYEEKELVAKQIKEFYFGDKPVNKDTALNYMNYFSDVLFTYSTLRSTKFQVEAGNNEIYLYEYSFKDKDTDYGLEIEFDGANHCAQTIAVLDGDTLGTDYVTEEESLSSEYKEMKQNIRELWLNFITTRSPVANGSTFPAWPPVQKANGPYMSLDRNIELRESLLLARFQFWERIYEKHYRVPIPPPVHIISGSNSTSSFSVAFLWCFIFLGIFFN